MPVKKLATPASAAVPVWHDPGDDQPHKVSVVREMQKILPWLRDALPPYLCSAKLLPPGATLVDARPLPIAVGQTTDMKNYKEVWNPENCLHAVGSTGM